MWIKKIYLILVLSLVVLFTQIGNSQNLPIINKLQKSFSLYIDKFNDTPLIFGYKLPDINSNKMICFSSLTSDVESNPHQCILGSFYETGNLNIKYISIEGNFVKLKCIEDKKQDVFFYIEKKYVTFE